MLSEKKIPTPLMARGGVIHDVVDIVPPRSPRARRLSILHHMIRWCLAVFWMWATRRWTSLAHAQRTRELFEHLGYLWIKAGQLLSLRSDLFSKEFCNELARLQYRANGFPPELSRQTIEEELGGPLEQFFDEFEEHPFAAASIAQIHRARLKREKVAVAVKVIRPDTDDIYTKDMNLFHHIVRILMRIQALGFLRLEEGIWELDQIMIEETDYRYELSNLRRMRRNLRKHNIYVPKPFPAYCTKHVLVTEYVTGVLMSHYIKTSDTDPDRVAAWQAENNVDPRRVGRRLYLSFLRQLFEENLFHGDLHPGNIVLLRDSRLALIDFATVGTLDINLLQKYLFIMKAITAGELDKVADLALALSPELPVVDIERVKQDMIRALRAWTLRTPVKALPYSKKSLTEVVIDLAKVMAQNKIMVTWGFLKIDGTWGTMEASMNHLNPQVDYPKLFRRYFNQRQRRTFRKMLTPQTLRSMATEIPETISEYTLFLDPQLRNASRVFQGSSSKIADALSSLFGALAGTMLLVGLGVVTLFLNQHHALFETIGYEKEDILHTVVQHAVRVPFIEYELWGIPALASFYLYYKLRKLRNRFGQKDVRLPSHSTGS